MGTLALPSAADIQKYARGALVAAGAQHTIPVPLDEVAQAAGLLPAESLYDLGDDLPPEIAKTARCFARKIMGVFASRERRIYLDSLEPSGKQRFTYGHEIGQSALPWHQGAYAYDDSYTLSPRTTELLEEEANAFASDLLFGVDRFTEEADSFAPGVIVPLSLAENMLRHDMQHCAGLPHSATDH